MLSIVPSADGTALFCGLARRPGRKSEEWGGGSRDTVAPPRGWLKTRLEARACRLPPALPGLYYPLAVLAGLGAALESR